MTKNEKDFILGSLREIEKNIEKAWDVPSYTPAKETESTLRKALGDITWLKLKIEDAETKG